MLEFVPARDAGLRPPPSPERWKSRLSHLLRRTAHNVTYFSVNVKATLLLALPPSLEDGAPESAERQGKGQQEGLPTALGNEISRAEEFVSEFREKEGSRQTDTHGKGLSSSLARV